MHYAFILMLYSVCVCVLCVSILPFSPPPLNGCRALDATTKLVFFGNVISGTVRIAFIVVCL